MFTNKCFLITGGANGIGLSTARLLKQRGATLVLWDMDAVRLDSAVRELGATGCVVDVTKPEMIQQGMNGIERLDGVIHCAGIGRAGRFEQVNIEQHRRVVETNLFGSMAVAQAVLPLLRQSRGMLVLVASVSAFYGTPDFASYAATKAGVLSLAQALDMEWKENGVRIGVICPHFADTALYREAEDKVALARGNRLFVEVTTPEQVARSILHGMERGHFMIWSSWRTRFVYWLSRYGNAFAPMLMMWQWKNARRRKPT